MMHPRFLIFAQLPAGLRNVPAVIAACRAGGIGVVNGELQSDAERIVAELAHVAINVRTPFGLSVDAIPSVLADRLPDLADAGLRWILVDRTLLEREAALLASLRQRGVSVLARITSADNLPCDNVDGLVVKGNEAGGFVGEDSSFVLLQKCLPKAEVPLYVHGGLTPDVAAACRAMGVAGGILDSQLLLLDDLHPPQSHEQTFGKLAGSETVAVGSAEHGEYFRVLVRPGHEAAKTFAREGDNRRFDALAPMVAGKLEWNELRKGLLPVGQDICFAARWRNRYRNLARVFKAIHGAVEQNLRVAVEAKAISTGAPLARALKIRLPIVQGPMTRVSDRAEFARVVAEAGALPMLALALMKGQPLRDLLAETKQSLGDRAWGVGLLGFAPQSLLDEQLAAALEVSPAYAIIAGGRPDQVVELEKAGIPSFLHVPSSALIGPFLRGGSRRFIFEGRECGGHVGPLSSFVLWSTMVATLVEELDQGVAANEISVLFAGGIHDAASSAMVQVLAAPLVEKGVNVGILMGSAYLFTQQIVDTGAIVPAFQQEVIACEKTVTLASGPGHASRCAYTPFAEEFFRTRERLESEGVPADEERRVLDDLILGRLRIASKGIERVGAEGQLEALDEARQRARGMYMLGQVATLRAEITNVDALHDEVSRGAASLLDDALQQLDDAALHPDDHQAVDIAVIGIGSLFPRANSTEEYWHNILGNVDAIGEIPPHRWDWRLYFDSDRNARDKIYSKWGGFCDDLVFDPMKYGIPPRSVKAVDPMQLIALEVAQRTLADSGYSDRSIDHERTSVVIGMSGGVGDVGTQYCLRSELPRYTGELPDSVSSQLPEWTEDSFPGILPNVIAGRVANRLNFGGVNYTTDAACASSLAAVYQGVGELVAGRADLVIAGAVDTVQSPFTYLCFSKTQALSPRGRCSSFAAGSDGIVISEGVAMVALKRLADAERDGDRIYAVIKGVGGSSDGNARGLTAPVPAGQLRAMRRAYATAGFGPETVGLFEAHGTGTVAGDIAELKSTSQLVRESGGRPFQAVIGSVKTTIGHTKSSAGMAGLVKIAMALHRRVLPPHHFADPSRGEGAVEEPNPVLQRKNSPLHLLEQPRPWLAHPEFPRRAAVSAFGFGGTNFHVVMEEHTAEYRPWMRPQPVERWPAELLLWSASDAATLLADLERMQAALAGDVAVVLRDLAAALAQRFVPGSAESLAIVARTQGDLATAVAGTIACMRGETDRLPRGVHRGTSQGERGKVAVLFSGQGSQYPEMLRELMVNFPVCADTLAEAEQVLAPHFEARFGEGNTLSHFVFPRACYSAEAKAAAAAALTSTDVAQPALGAVDAAAFHLLRNLGVHADLFAGHSFGEFVALYAGGAIDFASMLALAAERGRAIVDASKASGVELGTMAAVLAPRDRVEAAIAGIADVVIANHNGPEQIVLSGTKAAIAVASSKLGELGLRVTEFPVAAGFHSPQVRPAQEALAIAIAATPWAPLSTPVYSNTTGEPHAADVDTTKRVMADHLVRPVEFVAQTEAMYRDGARIFIELGPKSVLSRLVDGVLGDRPHVAVSIDRVQGMEGFLGVLGQLACAGVELDLAPLFTNRATPLADPYVLPAAPVVPKHAWYINGSGVRPVGAPPKQVGITFEDAQAIAARRDASPSPVVAAPAPAAAPAVTIESAPRVIPVAAPPVARPVASPPVAAPVAAAAVTRNTIPVVDARAPKNGVQPRVAEVATSAATARPAVRTPQSSPPPSASAAAGRPKVPTMNDDQSTLNGYFNMMRAFLETQERVMSMVLRGTASERARVPVERVLPASAAYEAIALPAQPQVTIAPAPVGMPVNGHAKELAVKPSNGAPSNGTHSPPTNGTHAPPSPSNGAQAAPTNGASQAKSATLDRAALTDLLLGVVEEKTGYPRDMVSLTQNLESDLGIDSIKRVEVATAMLEYLPDAHRKALTARLGQLNTQPTLEGMLGILDSVGGQNGETTIPFDVAEAGSVADVGHPPRFVMVAHAQPLGRSAARRIKQGRFLVTDDAIGVADEIAKHLEREGCTVARVGHDTLADEAALAQWVAAQPGEIAGVVHLAPIGAPVLGERVDDWRRALLVNEKSLFLILHHLGSRLAADAHVVACSALGGSFGRTPAAARDGLALQGGAVGLLKSLYEERPTLRVKAVDLDTTIAVASIAASVIDEVAVVGGRQEVGYPAGERTEFHTAVVHVETSADRFVTGQRRVILATGGARGVTAEVLREVAVPGTTLVLTGRRGLPEAESPATASATTAGELRNVLIAQARNGATKMTPAEIGRRVQAILGDRELRANLDDFRRRGATVEYHGVDVVDEASLHALITDVVARHGAITGILHGAGIIEDKLLADKTSDSWSRVVDTKVLGTLLLAKLVQPDALEFFAVMSSVAGRYGNSGQCDYATANELMNRLCCQLRDAWQGRVNVMALCWGPWGATAFGQGMVNAATEAKFAEKGVFLVSAAMGRKLFGDELRRVDADVVEVVCGAGPWESHEAEVGVIDHAPPGLGGSPADAVARGALLGDADVVVLPKGERVLTVRLDARHPYLAAHRIDGVAILPAAGAVELFAEAGAALWPGWKVVEVKECRVLKGVDVEPSGRTLEIELSLPVYGSSEGFEVTAVMRSGVDAPRIHYRAMLKLAQVFSPDFVRSDRLRPEKSLTVDKAYGEWLFHGPCFQVIERIDGLAVAGAEALVRATTPAQLVSRAEGDRWLFDPAVLDAAPQMAILWARAFTDQTALPTCFGRVVRFVDALPDRMRMVYECLPATNPHQVRANVYYLDRNDNVVMMIEELEGIASSALNRLAHGRVSEASLSVGAV
jgi:acyl transferase domain-containing protein/NADP-dependent 3-hydroxy acid dehydrogenase YdfG